MRFENEVGSCSLERDILAFAVRFVFTARTHFNLCFNDPDIDFMAQAESEAICSGLFGRHPHNQHRDEQSGLFNPFGSKFVLFNTEHRDGERL